MSDPVVTPTPPVAPVAAVAPAKHVQLTIPVPSFRGVPDWRTVLILVAIAYFGWTQLGKPHLRVPWYVPGAPEASLPAPKDAVETAALASLRGDSAALEAAAASLPPGKADPAKLAKAIHDSLLPLATALTDAIQADPDTPGALRRAAAIRGAYTR